MPQVGQTYTPDNAYEKKASDYRSQLGDNPAAIKQAAGQEMIATDQPLQEAVQGQGGALDAMAQLAQHDMQRAQEYRASLAQQSQMDAAQRQQLAAAGSLGSTAQDTINKAANQQFDLGAFTQKSAEASNLLTSPFIASQLTSGQQQAAQGTYDLAAQLRGSRERAIGTQAQSIADIAATQIERDRLAQEQEEAKKLAMYNSAAEYAKTYGGEVVNPLTGQKEVYKSEMDRTREELEMRRQIEKGAEQSVLQKLGRSGKPLIDEVTDGMGSFTDIIRENPGLTEDEMLALARANVSKFGAFKETPEQLQSLGLGFILKDPSLIQSGQTGQNYIGQVIAAGRGDLLKDVPAAEKENAAKYLIEAGELNKPKELSESAKTATTLIDEILNRNTEPLTGNIRMGILGGFNKENVYTAEKIKQLNSLLQLANTGKLGPGTISDKERAILAQAAAALNITQGGTSKLSGKDFKTELQKIRGELSGKSPAQPQQPQTNSRDQVMNQLKTQGFSDEDIQEYLKVKGL